MVFGIILDPCKISHDIGWSHFFGQVHPVNAVIGKHNSMVVGVLVPHSYDVLSRSRDSASVEDILVSNCAEGHFSPQVILWQGGISNLQPDDVQLVSQLSS